MGRKQTVDWHQVDQEVCGLETGTDHEIRVKRETIPLIFVPGIMGSRLRRTGTNGQGTGADNLPNLRWDPGSSMYMLSNYSGESAHHRKRMLVGDRFSSDFLEVDNLDPVGDGFNGIMEDYWKKFLNKLKQHDWGPLGKIFEFPVYAFGYNWTDSNENSGKKLASRIKEIMKEGVDVTGLCERVILITHSMGGLVGRWASQIAGAQASVLGIIHGVQPTTGAAAAYWRIKAGFEGLGMSSRVLGHSAHEVTPILGNLPGGLQLLPTKLHRTNAGSPAWLTVTENKHIALSLPQSDPYSEIYRVKAVTQPKAGERPSTNPYWGLVDPDLLDPDASGNPASPPSSNDNNSLEANRQSPNAPWDQYLRMLGIAESFHNTLGKQAHTHTFNFHGYSKKTADVIEMRVESNWVRSDPYPQRGFRGFFRNGEGKDMQAVLQDPAGDGDGTVPVYSSAVLDSAGKPAPGDTKVKVEHQPAYEDGTAQKYVIQAINALCKIRYQERRGG